MSAARAGRIEYDRYRADGAPVLASIHVPRPHHVEGYLCPCRCSENAANAANFFGPAEAA